MFTLHEIVPWGRSFDEYRRMFALEEHDLARRILGCGDGPASFNAEAARRGADVVSCDPLYVWEAARIRDRIVATCGTVIDEARRNADAFVWRSVASPDDLGRIRMAAMEDFLLDYEGGRAEGRYVAGALPDLPFLDASFDLALCSHLLFLYSDRLDAAFHRAALRELCRVAQEVRVFPLIALTGERSSHVESAVEDLSREGHHVSIQRVPYEFQRGGHEMLRVRCREGHLAGA